jgi:predicted DNA-binding transcriptional regulator AlpA
MDNVKENVSNKQLLTLQQFMDYCQVRNKRTIYKMIDDGMPVLKYGGQLRFDPILTDEWSKSRPRRYHK